MWPPNYRGNNKKDLQQTKCASAFKWQMFLFRSLVSNLPWHKPFFLSMIFSIFIRILSLQASVWCMELRMETGELFQCCTRSKVFSFGCCLIRNHSLYNHLAARLISVCNPCMRWMYLQAQDSCNNACKKSQ